MLTGHPALHRQKPRHLVRKPGVEPFQQETEGVPSSTFPKITQHPPVQQTPHSGPLFTERLLRGPCLVGAPRKAL